MFLRILVQTHIVEKRFTLAGDSIKDWTMALMPMRFKPIYFCHVVIGRLLDENF